MSQLFLILHRRALPYRICPPAAQPDLAADGAFLTNSEPQATERR